ncbi:hypothetical protein C1H46_031916 [Malus baccata]|uniref:Uncharacterized protein n=1 Tax=Malus baccata TaxID=106549 RepID=A0A540L7S6_MALBA|nr:hypothetical protein C1H46_031916 [Malus baccata]
MYPRKRYVHPNPPRFSVARAKASQFSPSELLFNHPTTSSIPQPQQPISLPATAESSSTRLALIVDSQENGV